MSVHVRAGNNKHPVTIQTVTKADDDFSTNAAETVVTFGKARASIRPVSADERTKNGKLTMEITHGIRIRYREGVTPGMKIIKDRGNRSFRIVSILNPEEIGVAMDLMCKEDV